MAALSLDYQGLGADRWPSRIRLIRLVSAVVSAAAVIVDASVVALDHDAPGVYVALTLAAVGSLAAYRRPVAGLALTIASCVAAIAVGVTPTAQWTIVVFVLLSATL